MSTRPRPFRSALVSVLAAFGASCGGGTEAAVAGREPAPVAIEVVDLAGIEQALAARRGEGFLLNVWATWCAPCVAELPELAEVVHARAGADDALLTISYDLMIPGVERATIAQVVRDFLATRELAFPVLVFDEPDFERIDARFDLPGEIPVTLAIDARGEIVDRQHGPAGAERFGEMLAKALGE